MLVKTKAHILGDKQIQIAIPIGIQKAGTCTDFFTFAQACLYCDISECGVTVVLIKDIGSEVIQEYVQMAIVVIIADTYTQMVTRII